ncbi:hypothetical protein [Pedobacter sp. SYSU D00535]|uniref:hypothetical protein n=1 Tax=Pedobacter sp. SYSU D00535 TaxID=2810308 RepID=UPI001A96D1F6|nr:hypothetical protein [Pedobacter sp. SYSU D00535]
MKRKARRIDPMKQKRRSKAPEIPIQVTESFGFNIPPETLDVLIYFEQKEAGEAAQHFVDEQEKSGWKTKTGKPIRNWKVHASDWIFNYKQERKFSLRTSRFCSL